MRLGRQLVLAGFAASALAIARPVEAANDAHFGGDDVRVTVDEAGVARVEHAISYRVTGSLPNGFDLTAVQPEAIVDPLAPVALDGETTNAARVERKGERALRVSLDGAPRKPGSHAVFVVRVSYTVDLVRARELTVDAGGAMWRLAWTGPEASEGYDDARAVFDLPAAPTEPRPLAADGAVGEDGRVVTLRRGAQRDELEMVRPHVARAEAATWALRVDPRAFPRVTDPSLRPPAPQREERAPARGVSAWLVAIVAGAIFGALIAGRGARFGRLLRARGLLSRAAFGGSPVARAWLGGGALATGIACQAFAFHTWGALALIVAMFAAVVRAPRSSAPPRGPGHWLPLAPGEAFARDAERDWFDLATWGGKAALLGIAGASVGLGLALRAFDPSLTGWVWLAPLDALALLPLFVTGSRAQLPPDRARAPKRRLSALHRALKRDTALRVAPWARVPVGATIPDELRLLVLPRAAIPGVVGIEVGVAWLATPSGYAPETEVLVRVREATAAAARMVALRPRSRSVHGRKTDERVVRLVPALPTRAGALALVRRLASELRDRRKSLPGVVWSGADRRLPPNERARAA